MTCGELNACSPMAWDATFSGAPVLSSAPGLLQGGLLRRWTGTSADMDQPPLDHHFLTLHLGGPKCVRRSGEGKRITADIGPGHVSVVPAGATFDWTTQGPIDFAHLYISPRRFDRTISEAFDREPRSVALQDCLGLNAPLLEQIVLTMLEDLRSAADGPPRLYYEGLFDAALLRLVHLATNAKSVAVGARQAMAPHRLRRVTDFIVAHIAQDIDLQGLADVAGLSRFHFSRAFQQSTGFSPYVYVTRARVARAKLALSETNQSVSAIARLSGFNSAAQFSSTFKKVAGVSPRDWRHAL